jgi:hypothetical protein
MKFEAPKFLDNIYRDMRDRRLLVPAIALIVALIAVPLVLKKPAQPAPPAIAVATPNTTAVTSAVLVDDTVQIRNYKKRLAKMKSTNPFEVDIKVESNGGDGSGSGDTGTAAPTDTSVSTTPPVSTGGDTASTDVSVSSPPDTSTNSTDGDTTDTPTQPEIRFVAGRVDVSFGPLGTGKDYNDVKYLTFLPNDETPIVAFVGLSESGQGNGAVFSVSSLAEVGEGEGTCALHKPLPCQFLTLKPGQERFIKYDGKSYRLKVRGTEMVTVDEPRNATASGDDSVTEGDAGTADGNGGTDGD